VIKDSQEGKNLTFKGKLNQTEEFESTENCQYLVKQEGTEKQVFMYKGGFKGGAFDGKGKIYYGESGNVFEGGFYRGTKHGEATFELAEREKMTAFKK
jgi:hypothetical protein